MRLTLRTLLAYLDDTLEAAEIRAIGQKVAESDKAQDLINRIKQVTRKRRLTTPPTTGPKGLDANDVAEYLDNVLPPERVSELEQIAIESDVHLAEVAASHQILTLVQGEPALVPPSARQRFYELVQGKESARRKAARPVPKAAPVLSGDPEADETLLLGLPMYQKAPWLRWGLPVAAIVVLALMAVLLYNALPRRGERGATPVASGSTPPTLTTQKTTTDKPAPEKDKPVTDKPVDKDKPDDKGTQPDKDRTTKDKENDKPLVDSTLPPREPSPERKEAGKFKSPRERQVLVRKPTGKERWERVAPESVLFTGEPLVCLPGYQADLVTPTVDVRLFGYLDDLYGWTTEGSELASPPRESAIIPHAAPSGIDLEFTLDRGRVYLTSLKDTPAVVRVRFAGEVWDLTLEKRDTRVALQLGSEFSPFYSPREDDAPLVEMDLLVEEGLASIKYQYKMFGELKPGSWNRIRWANKKGKFFPEKFDGPVPEFNSQPINIDAQKQMRAPLDELADRMTNQAGVETAIMAGVESDRPLDPSLCVRCLAAIDAIDRLLDLLGDPTAPVHVRHKAIFALRGYVNRGQHALKRLYDGKTKTGLLIEKQYKVAEAETILYFLRIFFLEGRGQAEVYRSLIDFLSHDKLAVRELAYWHLKYLAGEQGIRYDAAGDKLSRDNAAGEWKRLLSTGKLPPRAP